jgi:ATP-dependent helicase/nuclease subunit A
MVILADATADPARLGRTPITLEIEVEGSGVAPLLRPKKEERLPPFDALIAAEEKRDLEEHWRLLYVALTRAADRLIVTGVAPKPKSDGSQALPANCWQGAVERAVASLGADEVELEGWGKALVYGSSPSRPAKAPVQTAAASTLELPDWATSRAPAETRPPRPLAPSALALDDVSAPPPSEAMRAAAQRGTLIHQLLERLPAVAPDRRAEAAERWLEGSAGVADPAERGAIVGEVCRILSDPRFAALFGPGSLAEAPLAATLPDGRVIAGTVDRLLVEAGRISVIDFKTGRVPTSEADVPASHRAQMEAYCEALRVIFPGHQVDAALLYTAGPKLLALAA